MKAVICKKYGPPDVLHLSEVPKPIPEADEVLVRIRATAVTASDIFIRSSQVPLLLKIFMRIAMGITRPRQPILGLVFSGEVESAGAQIEKLKVGDQVFGLTGFSLGTYCEYKCMKEYDSKKTGCISLKPGNLSHEEATAAAYGGLLAFQYLGKGNIQSSDRVLIYGASSTSGTIAVQLAKTLGAEVTGVCSTRNVDFVKSLGAEKVLDYSKEDSIGLLEEYDMVLDCVGKMKTSALRKAIEGSRNAGTKFVSIDDGALILSSSRLDEVSAMVEDRKIKPVLDKIYSIDDIRAAHEYVGGGHKRGGVAISVD